MKLSFLLQLKTKRRFEFEGMMASVTLCGTPRGRGDSSAASACRSRQSTSFRCNTDLADAGPCFFTHQIPRCQCCAQVIEGVFKLEAPPVILGYQQISDRPSCVHLCLALRPQVVPPTLVEEERISGEAEDIAVLAARQALFVSEPMHMTYHNFLNTGGKPMPSLSRIAAGG